MSKVNQIINLAESQVNQKGEPFDNSKYNREFYGHDQNTAWCAVFIWWLFNKANALAAINNCKNPSVQKLYDSFPASAKYEHDPLKYAEPGDLIFFHTEQGDFHHVGLIVKKNLDGSVETVEGNTSPGKDGSQSNGNGVHKKPRQYTAHHGKKDFYIIAIAKPNYDAVITPEIPAVGDTLFDLPSGHYYGNRPSSASCHSGRIAKDKEAVRMIQSMLGISADGIFGANTEQAVKRWQTMHGLTADGMVGKQTWNAMFNNALPTPKPTPTPTPKPQPSYSSAIDFPLPAGHYFGNRPSSASCHSGRIAKDKQYVRMIQQKVGSSADGIFGAETASAVKRWQLTHGISADGLVGKQTWNAMFN